MEKQWVLVVELAGGFTYYIIYIYISTLLHILCYIFQPYLGTCVILNTVMFSKEWVETSTLGEEDEVLNLPNFC